MKFYIQQSALNRLKRTELKMDSTGRETAQISVWPLPGFVEVSKSEMDDISGATTASEPTRGIDMTEVIATVRDRAGRFLDVDLGRDVIRICDYALREL